MIPVRHIVARVAKRHWLLAWLTTTGEASILFDAYRRDGFSRRQAFRLAGIGVGSRPLVPGERARWFEKTIKIYGDPRL